MVVVSELAQTEHDSNKDIGGPVLGQCYKAYRKHKFSHFKVNRI